MRVWEQRKRIETDLGEIDIEEEGFLGVGDLYTIPLLLGIAHNVHAVGPLSYLLHRR